MCGWRHPAGPLLKDGPNAAEDGGRVLSVRQRHALCDPRHPHSTRGTAEGQGHRRVTATPLLKVYFDLEGSILGPYRRQRPNGHNHVYQIV